MLHTYYDVDHDAIIVGGGFGGLYMLHRLRDLLKLDVRLLEKGGGIGGVWYWNNYPGARCDTESWVYNYSFDRELQDEWRWSERYPGQSEVLAYLNHFAKRYDLMRSISLDTTVASVHFEEERCRWHISTGDGRHLTCRFLVTALGVLSATNLPTIPGIEKFEGDIYHTGAFPKDAQLEGRRIGVFGTGSSGVQTITAVASIAKHLTVFQRTPQYCVPAKNGPISEEQFREIRARRDDIYAEMRRTHLAFGWMESSVPALSVSDEERKRIYQEAWDGGGGFQFMFKTFGDIGTDEAANESAASFIRSKIVEIVDDPDTAQALTPTGLYAKRPICVDGYYAVFNRSNVTLVDIKANPVADMTAHSVRTTDGKSHEIDTLILATGFDGVDGSYLRLDLRGRGGIRVKDYWSDGPLSFLGMTTRGFPNLFMILGPNGPFTNLVPSIEKQVEWIARAIAVVKELPEPVIEASAQAQQDWMELCHEEASQSLFQKIDNWFFGANIPGKPIATMYYFGGFSNYCDIIERVECENYAGFELGLDRDVRPYSPGQLFRAQAQNI